MTIRNFMMVLLLLVFAAPGLSSCGSDSDNATASDGPAVQVTAMTVEPATEPMRLELSGELDAVNRINVASKIAGRIASFPVTEGTHVRRGDLLVKIDSPELVSALAQSQSAESAAKLAMETATRQADRFRRLAADEVVTPRDLEMMELAEAGAKSDYERARAMREMSERNLGYAEMRAPQDGVVIQRMARAGDLALPGRPILSLENPQDLEIRVTLPATTDFDVAPGMKAEVYTGLEGDTAYPAVVNRVTPGADRHTIVAYLRADGLEAPSGTFVRAFLFGPEASDVLRVPDEALVRRGALTGVYVISDGRATLRWLRFSPDGRVEAGLNAGEQIVLSPPAGLEDGDPVEVTR